MARCDIGERKRGEREEGKFKKRKRKRNGVGRIALE
jgi:hypothetical protein